MFQKIKRILRRIARDTLLESHFFQATLREELNKAARERFSDAEPAGEDEGE